MLFKTQNRNISNINHGRCDAHFLWQRRKSSSARALISLSLSSFTMEEKNLLKTCIKPAKDMYNIALRGYKKPSSTPAKVETLDMDSRVIATFC